MKIDRRLCVVVLVAIVTFVTGVIIVDNVISTTDFTSTAMDGGMIVEYPNFIVIASVLAVAGMFCIWQTDDFGTGRNRL